jgi:hypothetical protein
VPLVTFDREEGRTWGSVHGEWGRLLAAGFGTWVKGGGAFGEERPMRWTVEVGFRVVP